MRIVYRQLVMTALMPANSPKNYSSALVPLLRILGILERPDNLRDTTDLAGPSKVQKAQGIAGWYVDADRTARRKWVFEAVAGAGTEAWRAGKHPCEALGRRIDGDALDKHIVGPFNLDVPAYDDVPRSYDGLLRTADGTGQQVRAGHVAEAHRVPPPGRSTGEDQGQGLPQRICCAQSRRKGLQ
jgi:hypothetical protein